MEPFRAIEDVADRGAAAVDAEALLDAGVLLDGAEAANVMGAALATVGATLDGLQPTQVRYQPRRRLAVRYRADVRRGEAVTVETLVGLWQRAPLPAQTTVLADEHGRQVGVWAYPVDPWLPGLSAAADPVAVRRLLVGLGAADEPVSVRPVVYRPTARAVLAVSGPAEVHLKVVRPSTAARLHAVHARLAGSLPVPTSLGVSEQQGIVVLATRRGEPLGEALSTGRALPSPEAVVGLLDRLGGHEPAAPPVAPATAARDAACLLVDLAPEVAARVERVVGAVAQWPYEPTRTVHGDFYEAQVLVADGAVTGLLDVDGLRPGDEVDDVATLLAHLDVVAAFQPRTAARVTAFGEAVRRRALGDARDDVDVRVAGVLLGLAAWPFRVQLPQWRQRIAEIVGLAEQRLARSRRARGVSVRDVRADERDLIGASPSAQPPAPRSAA